MRRLLSILAAAIAVLVLTAGPAFAHVELAGSDPAAGTVLTDPIEQITLEFSVASVIAGDGIVLYGSDGQPVDANVEQISDTVVVLTPATALTDGPYAVTWSMQSGDAHPVTGGIEFSISIPATTAASQPDGTADAEVPADDSASSATAAPAAPVAAQTDGTSLLDSVLDPPGFPTEQIVMTVGRSAAIIASLLGIGALAFGALVLKGSRREAEMVGYWMRRAGAAVIVSAPVILVGRIIETGADGLGAIAFEMALQAAGGIALLAGTRIVTVPDTPARPAPGGATITMAQQRFRVGSSPLALAGMGALVLSFALDGHSGALQPVWLMVVASMVHVVAAAVWIGGVALIGNTLLGRARRGEPLATGSLVIPFSVIAAIAVTAVGVAGAVMTFVIADGIGTLFTTPWGWAMLSKLAFVAVAGAIGAYNHFALIPLLTAQNDHPYASDRIMHAVRIEIVCLVLAASITGALVGLSAV